MANKKYEYKIITEKDWYDEERYWIRREDTYIDRETGYKFYAERFFKTKEEYEKFVIENFNAYMSWRDTTKVEHHYSVYSGSWSTDVPIKIEELKYKTYADAQRALEWMNSGEILDKLAGA